jgi:uncharacterized repeat protein (TIGR01451 family)
VDAVAPSRRGRFVAALGSILLVLAAVPPVLAHSSSPASFDYGTVVLGTTATMDFVITVDADSRVDGISGAGTAAPYAINPKGCVGFVGPGTCTLTQTFTPTLANVNLSGSFNVRLCRNESCVPATLLNVQVQGTGGPARFSAFPGTHHHIATLGSSVSQDFAVTLDAGFSIDSITGAGTSAPFTLQMGTCAGFVGPGACVLTQTFTPTDPFNVAGSLTLRECLGVDCYPTFISIDGTGTSLSHDYGIVPLGVTATHEFSLTLPAGMSIGLITGGGTAPPFAIDPGTCVAFDGPGTCTLTQTFTPTLANVNLSGSFNVQECVGLDCATLNVQVQGTGGPAIIAVDPASHAYTSVPINTTVSRDFVVIVDPGFAVDRVIGNGVAAPFAIDLGTCADFVGPGTCVLTQTFTPTLRANVSGSFSVFECRDATCYPAHVQVQGTGVSVLAVDPAHVDFGEVPLGTSETRQIVMTIDTGFSFSSAVGLVNPAYGVDLASCAGFAGPGTCTLLVRFTPAALGPTTGGFTIFECATPEAPCLGLAKDVTLAGTGVLPPADLSVAMTGTPRPSAAKPVTYTITVRNLGPFAAVATLTDQLPASSRFLSVTTTKGSCSTPQVGDTGAVACAMGMLNPGETVTIVVVVKPTVKKAVIVNTATVASDGSTADLVAANNTATLSLLVK